MVKADIFPADPFESVVYLARCWLYYTISCIHTRLTFHLAPSFARPTLTVKSDI